MTKLGLNLNTTNMLGLMQMFDGSANCRAVSNYTSIFGLLGNCGSMSSNLVRSMGGSLLAGLVLNYAPQILGNFIGGVTNVIQTHRAAKAQQELQGVEDPQDVAVESSSDAVKKLIGEENFNKLSDSLKRDIQKKYEVLKTVRQLDDTQLTARLNTYIEAMTEGEKRNHIKEYVTQVLNDAQIPQEKHSSFIEAIIDKYNLIELFDPSNNEQKATLRKRIIAYANGLKYGANELNLALGNNQTYNNTAIKEAINNNDLEAYKEAHLQWGKEVVELYDSINPNGVINFEEFVEYQTQLAVMGGVGNLSDDPDLANALMKVEFDILDKDHNGYIDSDEMAIDLYATSKIQDVINGTATSYDITQAEYNDATMAKQAWVSLLSYSNVTSIKEFNSLSDAKKQEAINQLTDDEKKCWKRYNAACLTGLKNLI